MRAARWAQRRQFWGWSDDDQAELDRWLAESPAHHVAYMRLDGHLEPHRTARRSARGSRGGRRQRTAAWLASSRCAAWLRLR